MAAPIIMTLIGSMYNFKVNTSLLVLVFIFIFGVYFYEHYVIKKGKNVENYLSMLGAYQNSNSVFVPNKFENSSKNKTADDYSPQVAQPNQKYRQIHPDEYPTNKYSDKIQTPLSSHEMVVKELRKKMNY
jgi:hypothetical protein